LHLLRNFRDFRDERGLSFIRFRERRLSLAAGGFGFDRLLLRDALQPLEFLTSSLEAAQRRLARGLTLILASDFDQRVSQLPRKIFDRGVPRGDLLFNFVDAVLLR
jgi:hypothetical protein